MSTAHQPTFSAAEVAQRFLTSLEALDVDAAMSCFAEDGVQEMPFAPDGFPSRLDGMDALRRQYGGLPAAYRSMRFAVDSAYATADAEWAIVEYRGEIELKDGGHYNNHYIGVFHVVDGQIRSFREYFNPIVLSEAFGTEQMGDTFSLEDRA